MFAERFEAWKYGPVVDDVYQAFRDYGPNPIKRYMPDTNGRYQIIDLSSDPGFRTCFDHVWNLYASKTGIELSKITHEPVSAWYPAAAENQLFLSDEDIKKEMKDRANGR